MRTVIVALGAPNDDSGALSAAALARLAGAAAETLETPGALVLPTGGFGVHFNRTALPHHAYARRHLATLGVSEDRILEGVSSGNTVEDAFLAARVLAGLPEDLSPASGEANPGPRFRVIVVTSDYHGPRARYLFRLALSICLPSAVLEMRLVREDVPQAERERIERHEGESLETLRRNGVHFEGSIFKPAGD